MIPRRQKSESCFGLKVRFRWQAGILSLQNDSRPGAGMATVIENDASIHDYVFNAGRVLVRLFEGRVVDDARCVEYGDVCHHPRKQDASIENSDLGRIGRCHLPNRLFLGEYMALPNVASEHARERSVLAGMVMAGTERALGCHR